MLCVNKSLNTNLHKFVATLKASAAKLKKSRNNQTELMKNEFLIEFDLLNNNKRRVKEKGF